MSQNVLSPFGHFENGLLQNLKNPILAFFYREVTVNQNSILHVPYDNRRGKISLKNDMNFGRSKCHINLYFSVRYLTTHDGKFFIFRSRATEFYEID